MGVVLCGFLCHFHRKKLRGLSARVEGNNEISKLLVFIHHLPWRLSVWDEQLVKNNFGIIAGRQARTYVRTYYYVLPLRLHCREGRER